MLRLPALCCKLLFNLTPPPPSLFPFQRNYLRASWDAVPWAWSPKSFHETTLSFQVECVFSGDAVNRSLVDLLLSPSSHRMTGQGIRNTKCWGKEETLIGEPADLEDGRLVPQNNHFIEVWVPGSYIDQRWGEMRKHSKKAINLANIS